MNKEKPRQEREEKKDIQKEYFSQTYAHLLNLFADGVPLDKVYDDIAKFIKENHTMITTTQLRNIYSRVVDADSVQEVKMLRPNLVYIAARQGKGVEPIISFFNQLIKGINDEEQLKSFKKVMEAVVAYHKFYMSQTTTKK